MPGVVEPFVREPAGQRAVPENGGDLEILAAHVPASGPPERRGHCRSRVSSAECVVLAFGTFEKARNAILLAKRLELRVALGEDFVRITLMADVPHQLIARSVERVMKGYRKLDHAQSGADVPTGSRADV